MVFVTCFLHYLLKWNNLNVFVDLVEINKYQAGGIHGSCFIEYLDD